MWFIFPDGTAGVTVERQSFSPEATSPTGRQMFRAPDHFAPIITALPGFEVAKEIDIPTDIADLPRPDPLRDGAIAEQTQKIAVLEAQVSNLRMDLNARDASLAELMHERDHLKLELHEKEVKIHELEDKVEELEEAAPLPTNKPKRKTDD